MSTTQNQSFFVAMLALCQQGVSLKVNFSAMKDGQLGVIVEPTIQTEDPELFKTLQCFGAAASPEEWDKEFFNVIGTPIEQAAKIVWEANSILQEAEALKKAAETKRDAAKKEADGKGKLEDLKNKATTKGSATTIAAKTEPKPEPTLPEATAEQVAGWKERLTPGRVAPVLPKTLDEVRREMAKHTLTPEDKIALDTLEKVAEEAYKAHKAKAHPKGQMTMDVVKAVEASMKAGTTLSYVTPNLLQYEFNDVVTAQALEKVLDTYKDNKGLF